MTTEARKIRRRRALAWFRNKEIGGPQRLGNGSLMYNLEKKKKNLLELDVPLILYISEKSASSDLCIEIFIINSMKITHEAVKQQIQTIDLNEFSDQSQQPRFKVS